MGNIVYLPAGSPYTIGVVFSAHRARRIDMQAGADGGKPFTLGILFVHGIGTQARGQTLTSFGGAFYKWLEYRCAALAQSQQIATDVLIRSQQKLEAADWSNADVPATLSRASDDQVSLHRAVLRETTFQDQADPEAPAHTKIGLLTVDANEQVSVESWLLAESWWADRFALPSRAGALACCRGSSGAISAPRFNGAFTNALRFL
jgi:hypothetical protein